MGLLSWAWLGNGSYGALGWTEGPGHWFGLAPIDANDYGFEQHDLAFGSNPTITTSEELAADQRLIQYLNNAPSEGLFGSIYRASAVGFFSTIDSLGLPEYTPDIDVDDAFFALLVVVMVPDTSAPAFGLHLFEGYICEGP